MHFIWCQLSCSFLLLLYYLCAITSSVVSSTSLFCLSYISYNYHIIRLYFINTVLQTLPIHCTQSRIIKLTDFESIILLLHFICFLLLVALPGYFNISPLFSFRHTHMCTCVYVCVGTLYVCRCPQHQERASVSLQVELMVVVRCWVHCMTSISS